MCLCCHSFGLAYSYEKFGITELSIRGSIVRDNFCHFCTKTYVVIPHLNRLDETVQMMGHNICFQCEIRKVISQLSSNTPLI